jgi:hypothetical protein
MIPPAPDRVNVYHTYRSGVSIPQYTGPEASGLRAKVWTMTNSQALTANAEGRYQPQVTHGLRVEANAAVIQDACIERQRDGKCFLVRAVRESNQQVYGRPDHLICDLSVLDPAPEFV